MIWLILIYPVLFFELWIITERIPLSLLLAVPLSIVVLAIALWYGRIKWNRINKLLDEDCDIEGYEEALHKMYKKAKPGSVVEQNYLLCQSVSAMCKGEYVRADKLLNQINLDKYRGNRISLMTYYINRISCYYGMDEIEKGEELYETHLVRLPALNKRMRKSIDIMIAVHLYYTGKKEESYIACKKLLTPDLNKRQYLGIQYYIATIDLKNGRREEAKKVFEKIVRLGNQLEIVKLSKEILEKM